MTTLFRTRMDWGGFSGAPGVSTFYGLVDGIMVPAVRQLMVTLADHFPPNVQTQVENAGDSIEDTTGVLVGSWTGDPVLPVGGSGPTVYAAPVGFCINWNTATILDGHRVRGRTFFVPAVAAVFASDGTLNDTARNQVVAAANTFLAATSGNLAIWHRPRVARAATAFHPAITARAGGHGLVTGFSVPDKAVVLRSRRD